MTVTVFIRYQIDPFKRAQFEEYAKRWLTIIPKAGGDLLGYWMPHEGTNNIAFALISFESLAAYESLSGAAAQRQRGRGQFQFRRGTQIHSGGRADILAKGGRIASRRAGSDARASLSCRRLQSM